MNQTFLLMSHYHIVLDMFQLLGTKRTFIYDGSWAPHSKKLLLFDFAKKELSTTQWEHMQRTSMIQGTMISGYPGGLCEPLLKSELW